MSEKIGETESLCPECLRTVEAEKIAEGGRVYLVKECPEHGTFKTLIWRGVEEYKDLYRYAGVPSKPESVAVDDEGDCPKICGLCHDHLQHTCLVVLEVTNGCNLNCPICFARSNEGIRYHPSGEEIDRMWRTVVDYVENPICVQISGGEPTIRDDLPEIVRRGKEMGVDYIEVNTNGVRLGKDIDYLRSIKEAGVDSLYFSFDGVTGDIYEQTCGEDLLEIKKKALENCAEVGMGVTLVTVVSPHINLQQVGDIIQFAKEWIPIIKGVHFQPIAFFGRYPEEPRDEDRMLMPDLIDEIERQTEGEVRKENFIPTSCANVHCDAKSLSFQMEDGSLFPMTSKALGPPTNTEDIAHRTREEISDLWRFIDEVIGGDQGGEGTWTGFLQRAKTHYLTISMMPFQDVWNVETERLKRCCIHMVTPDGRLIPFCLYNISSCRGETLYRDQVLREFGKKD
ncbi:MAG: radical SAM (seleno)protein TrsS [Methanomassiliicoccales archaeon]